MICITPCHCSIGNAATQGEVVVDGSALQCWPAAQLLLRQLVLMLRGRRCCDDEA
jgi:hypothetical protein